MLLLHQRFFVGTPFHSLQRKTEVWNLVSSSQLLLLYTDSSGVSEHHLLLPACLYWYLSATKTTLLPASHPQKCSGCFICLLLKLPAFICFCSKLLLAFQFPLEALYWLSIRLLWGKSVQIKIVLTHQLGRLNPAFSDSFKYV